MILANKNSARRGRGGKAKKAGAAMLLLVAMSAFTFLTPSVASAQSGVILGGGGGGGAGDSTTAAAGGAGGGSTPAGGGAAAAAGNDGNNLSGGGGGGGGVGGASNGAAGGDATNNATGGAANASVNQGDGGGGGNALGATFGVTTTVITKVSSTPDASLGKQATSATGGDGGSADYTLTSLQDNDTISIYGAGAGEASDDASGGAGGSGSLTAAATLTKITAGSITLNSGASQLTEAGAAGTAFVSGGAAKLDLSGVDVTMVDGSDITMATGTAVVYDTKNGAAETSFTAKSLSTQDAAGAGGFTIELTDNAAEALKFTVDRINILAGDTVTLKTTNTTATNVNFGTLDFIGIPKPTAGATGSGALVDSTSGTIDGTYSIDGIYVKDNFSQWTGNNDTWTVSDELMTFEIGTTTRETTSSDVNEMLNFAGGLKLDLTDATLNNLKIENADGGYFKIKAGNTYTLIRSGSAITTGVNGAFAADQDVDYRYGSRYDHFVTSVDGNNLVLNYLGNTDMSALYSQGWAAGMTTVADGFSNTTDPTLNKVAKESETDRAFVTVNLTGSSIDTKTGSKIENDMFAGVLAGGYKFGNNAGATTLGAFLEFGKGDYDTSKDYNRFGTVSGSGDADYFGGGIFAHHDFNGGTWLEGSVRFGQVDNEFEFVSIRGNHYDTDTTYFGVNLGVGHTFMLSERSDIDLYGKFQWTSFDGESMITRSNQELINFDDVDSIRTRLGARYNQSFGDGTVKGYVGAAWQHEFDGEVTGTISDRNGTTARIGDADTGGSSAFMEAGLTFAPQDQSFAVEVGVFGLAGQQKGAGGTVGLKFEF